MKSAKGRIAVVLLVLICLFAGMANGEREAWECPECGRKGNTGNFCGNCKHPAPEAAPVYAAGDIITFGHYEQDNNLNNGPETIEWIVLDHDAAENKVLLLSLYGLDTIPYHGDNEMITWEKCSLRSWLHEVFLETAFTKEEQQKILKTNVDNSKGEGYSGWNTDGGNNTVDQVFLLSYREAFEKYFQEDQSRTCKPTVYAMAQGALTDSGSGNGWWWLRTPGSFQNNVASVNNDGSRCHYRVIYTNGCVRPALWLNLDSFHSGQNTAGTEPETEQSYGPDSMSGFGYTIDSIELKEKADVNAQIIQRLNKYTLCRFIDTATSDGITWYQVTYNEKNGYVDGMFFKQLTMSELNRFLGSAEYNEGIRQNAEAQAPTPQKTYSAGDIITFGHYEQDNNLNNGQEAIEWIMLDYDATGNKVLLLSRYGLDAKPYHVHSERITWGECSLRSWLNGEFLKTAFTIDEQHGILKTNVDNSKSQGYSEWNSDDRIRINTADQIFLLSYWEAFEKYFKDDQSRTCKPTAYAIAQGALSNRNSGNGWWWLRSPGEYQDRATNVNYVGSRSSHIVNNDSGCVRPALWLNLDSGIL